MFCCFKKKTNVVSFIKSPMYEQISINELINAHNVPIFSLDGMSCLAKIVDIYDGDSCKLVMKYGGRLQCFNCRLAGIDTPEMKPLRSKPGRELEIENAIKCRNRLAELCCDYESPSSSLHFKKIISRNTKIVQIDCGKFDKYGRLLVIIFINGQNVNEILVNEGYAKKYDGGTKEEFKY